MFDKIRNAFSNAAKSLGEKELADSDIESVLFELEMALLESDVAAEVIDSVKSDLKEKLIGSKVDKHEIEKFVKDSLISSISLLFDAAGEYDLFKKINESKNQGKPFLILFVGINGTGKTTSLAKVAYLLKEAKYSVVIAAADTFRAGAIEQLREHANRLNLKLVAQNYNSDPAAVARDAVLYAKSHRTDCVLIDTAGRMQTSENLMQQIAKITKVVNPDMKIFVGDSLAGNDTVNQAREFFKHVKFDGSILTKSDADARGGAALSVVKVTSTPVLYVGVGQEYPDLQPFDKKSFLETVFGSLDGVNIAKPDDSVPQLEPGLTAQQESIQEPESSTKPEHKSIPEPESSTKPEHKSIPEPESSTKPQPESIPEPELSTQSQSSTKPQPESIPEPESSTKPQSESTTQPPTQSESTTQPPTQSESTTQPPTQSESTTQPPTQSESTTQPPTQSESTTQPPTQSESTTQPPTQSESTTQPPTQSESTTQPPTQSESTTQSKSESTTQSKSESTPPSNDPFEGIKDDDIAMYSDLFDVTPPENNKDAVNLAKKINQWIKDEKPQPTESFSSDTAKHKDNNDNDNNNKDNNDSNKDNNDNNNKDNNKDNNNKNQKQDNNEQPKKKHKGRFGFFKR